MKTITLHTIIIVIIFSGILNAQTIYVDIKNGNNKNNGRKNFPVQTLSKAAEIANSRESNNSILIKVAPGLYNLEGKVIFNKGNFTGTERLIIEASVLPGDTSWNHSNMPVIMSTSPASSNFGFDCSIGINIEVSHATIRGIKFLGNPNPDVFYYYAIGRSEKKLTDLEVTQCVFVGDKDAMPVQAGILAHGNQVKVTNCIFYKCKNSVVYYFANENRNIERYGSEMSYCIVDEAYESGIWTASPDIDFKFNHNIITNCKYAWVHNVDNNTKYRIEDCIITNNENYITSLNGKIWEFSPSEINYFEVNVIKNGEIKLQGKIDDNLMPRDYLHVVNGKFGSKINAGIFLNHRDETANELNNKN